MSADLNTLILHAIRHFGDVTTGQVAAWIAAPDETVSAALSEMLAAGTVGILPKSLTWTVA